MFKKFEVVDAEQLATRRGRYDDDEILYFIEAVSKLGLKQALMMDDLTGGEAQRVSRLLHYVVDNWFQGREKEFEFPCRKSSKYVGKHVAGLKRKEHVA